MSTAYGPGCDPGIAFGQPQVDPTTVLTIAAGDGITLPLTWWQTPPTYGADGVTIVTPGVPVNMTGMQPGAEFLTFGQAPYGGTPLAVSLFVAASGSWTVTAPGFGQSGDLTSRLPSPAPATLLGPRIRVFYTDAAGPHTFGTFHLAVK